MSVYKVPQDVEAEDKLLGPFSFRQFIFLIIAVVSLGAAYILARILLPLGLIPVPIALFFGALALPLRKDQPMEVYLAAVISFMLKPKKRLWQPDGIEYLVEVTAPKTEETTRRNSYNQEEVQRRLSYLANLVDSRGWSIRGVNDPDSSMQADLYNEAQTAFDPLDETGATAQNITNLINQSDARRRQAMIQTMSAAQQIAPDDPQSTSSTDNSQSNQSSGSNSSASNTQSDQTSVLDDSTSVDQQSDIEQAIASSMKAGPYPTMRQSTLIPLDEIPVQPAAEASAPTAPPQTSLDSVSPAIIDLAKNHRDFSIQTIQRVANEIEQREKKAKKMEDEVVISLH
ncbi:MAG: PrgI family protein [Candidatus Saccharimonas sp.]|nr:MAG: PrgI family protein [Candidatus Saccharimonas sp.]